MRGIRNKDMGEIHYGVGLSGLDIWLMRLASRGGHKRRHSLGGRCSEVQRRCGGCLEGTGKGRMILHLNLI